nr:MAG TPA: hypothetical protein [Bacteriophage sp.]
MQRNRLPNGCRAKFLIDFKSQLTKIHFIEYCMDLKALVMLIILA